MSRGRDGVEQSRKYLDAVLIDGNLVAAQDRLASSPREPAHEGVRILCDPWDGNDSIVAIRFRVHARGQIEETDQGEDEQNRGDRDNQGSKFQINPGRGDKLPFAVYFL
jgi:hypothetical protein